MAPDAVAVVHDVDPNVVMFMFLYTLGFAEQSCGNIAYVCFFQLVQVSTHLVDSYMVECLHNSRDIKTHIDEAVNHCLIVTIIGSQICCFLSFLPFRFILFDRPCRGSTTALA